MESFFFPETLKYLYLLFDLKESLAFDSLVILQRPIPSVVSWGVGVWTRDK